MPRTGSVLTTLLLLGLGQIYGQQATFVGVVADSLTGDPLAGAYVSLAERELVVVTGINGWFELRGEESGGVTVEIRRPGFKAGAVHLDLTVTRAVTVDLGTIMLSPLVVEMDPLVVEGAEVDQKLARVGFFQRMGTEHGTFLTHEEIARRNPRATSDLIRRIPGFRVNHGGGMGNSVSGGRGVPSISQGFARCDIDYYIDGVHADGAVVDDVFPDAIAAMEVLRRSIESAYGVRDDPTRISGCGQSPL